MKKLLFIAHTMSAGGGAEKVLYNLLCGLSTYYDIDLIERLECSTYQYSLPENVHKLKSMSFTQRYMIDNHKNSFGGLICRRLLAILTFIFPKWIYRLYVKKRDYDAEISFSYLYPSLLVANSCNKRSRKIMWIHGTVDDLKWQNESGLRKYLYKAYYNMQKRAFIKADYIVSIATNTKDSINRLFPGNELKIKLIYNGYDFGDITAKADAFITFPKKKKYRLISIGRLDYNKNIILQLQLMKRLCEENIDIELVVVGDGPEKQRLMDYVHDNGLEKWVFFTGFLENPYPLLKSSDCLLISSYLEGFSTVAIEAMALGVPVVSVPVGGIDEIILEDYNGYITRMDVNSLFVCVMRVLNKEWNQEAIKKTVSGLTSACWTEKVIKLLENSRT